MPESRDRGKPLFFKASVSLSALIGHFHLKEKPKENMPAIPRCFQVEEQEWRESRRILKVNIKPFGRAEGVD